MDDVELNYEPEESQNPTPPEELNSVGMVKKLGSFCMDSYWMTKILKLKGNARSIFSIVYSYTISKHGMFEGSQTYFKDRLGVSIVTIQYTLKRLEKSGYIVTNQNLHKQIKAYAANLDEINKLLPDDLKRDAVDFKTRKFLDNNKHSLDIYQEKNLHPKDVGLQRNLVGLQRNLVGQEVDNLQKSFVGLQRNFVGQEENLQRNFVGLQRNFVPYNNIYNKNINNNKNNKNDDVNVASNEVGSLTFSENSASRDVSSSNFGKNNVDSTSEEKEESQFKGVYTPYIIGIGSLYGSQGAANGTYGSYIIGPGSLYSSQISGMYGPYMTGPGSLYNLQNVKEIDMNNSSNNISKISQMIGAKLSDIDNQQARKTREERRIAKVKKDAEKKEAKVKARIKQLRAISEEYIQDKDILSKLDLFLENWFQRCYFDAEDKGRLMTNISWKSTLTHLLNIAKDNTDMVNIIDNAIRKGYLSFYPVDSSKNSNTEKPAHERNVRTLKFSSEEEYLATRMKNPDGTIMKIR